MSWPDKIENDIVIQTGDGQQYKPLWSQANKSKDFNVSQFNFIDTPGTLVKREQPQGRQFTLNLVFQGETNLDEAQAFDESADNPNPWSLSHPLYGQILVQPTSISFDDSQYNISRVSVEVIETIEEAGPEVEISTPERVKEEADSLDTTGAEAFASDAELDSETTRRLDATELVNEIESDLQSTEAAEKLNEAKRQIDTEIQKVNKDSLTLMRKSQQLLRAPEDLKSSVENRIGILESQFNLLRETVTGDSTVNEKRSFEIRQSSNLAAQNVASTTNFSYKDRTEALQTASRIKANYDTYLNDLVELQDERAGTPSSFMPMHDVQRQLASLVNLTTSKLFDIAFGLRKERTFVLENNTTLFELAHRLYGLDSEDENLNALLEQNNLRIDELLVLPAGKQIKYYS